MIELKSIAMIPNRRSWEFNPVDINWNAIFSHHLVHRLGIVPDVKQAKLLDYALPANSPFYIKTSTLIPVYYRATAAIMVQLNSRLTGRSFVICHTDEVNVEDGLLSGEALEAFKQHYGLRDSNYLVTLISKLYSDILEGGFERIFHSTIASVHTPKLDWVWQGDDDIIHQTKNPKLRTPEDVIQLDLRYFGLAEAVGPRGLLGNRLL